LFRVDPALQFGPTKEVFPSLYVFERLAFAADNDQ
jgi:hypothetical protein